ncbi:MAG: hypothetical protein ACFFF9_09680 [Candidatus Thorarchaeota archaeon]
MPDPKELKRIDGLFNLASARSRPFLDQCSEAKYLAVRDYNRAADETLKLAMQTLKFAGANSPALTGEFSEIRSAVKAGQLDTDFIKQLSTLRTKYIKQVLRPAVKTYLSNEDFKTSDLDSYYESALRIDGLLEVVQFLKRIRPDSF